MQADFPRVTIWHEYQHEKRNPQVSMLYPKGMHETLADGLRAAGAMTVRTATLEEPDHGLTPEVLAATDVLIWWGHMAHDAVHDDIVQRAHARVLAGMGLIVLHSAHFSKLFKRLMGTTCDLKWREADDREILWVTAPGHPILHGISDHVVLPREEMYGEHFDIPEPDETILISSFSGGEVFRSGLTWRRGMGRIFYFRPGHETYPTYHNPQVMRIIANAVQWAAPTAGAGASVFGNHKPLP
ncbi:MAG: trehalose utilization protein ThuA [Phycisphaerales bacterium]|nr:trehalose utilization protein ThuA [Phycisphaerales bacterium]